MDATEQTVTACKAHPSAMQSMLGITSLTEVSKRIESNS